MRLIRVSWIAGFVSAAAAVALLGGCGRGISSGESPVSAVTAPSNPAEEALQPLLGKYQITAYQGGTNVKGTLEIVLKDFGGVTKAGIVVTQDPASKEPIPNEEKLTVVSQTTFSTKNGTINQKYVDPRNANVHLELTYKKVGTELVINSQDCNDETCQLQQFKVKL